MNPDINLFEFMVYVLPGFIAYVIYDKVFPGRRKSNFILAGTCFFGGVLIFSVIRYLDETTLSGLLQSAEIDPPSTGLVLTLMLGGAIVGLLQTGWHDLRVRLGTKHQVLRWLMPDPGSIWSKVNIARDNDWAVVHLRDGSIYLGHISQYLYDPDREQQDFLLAKARRLNDKMQTRYIVTGKGVYLTTDSISRIEYYKAESGSR